VGDVGGIGRAVVQGGVGAERGERREGGKEGGRGGGGE